MDKSLGTNLHLWRFFTPAKRTARREFMYICSARPTPTPLYNIGHVYTLFFQRFNIVWGGGGGGGKATHFETEGSAFLKVRFKHTEN